MNREKSYKLFVLCILSGVCLAFTSCLKDEPLKLPYEGFEPQSIPGDWQISCPGHENMDSMGLDAAYRFFYREDEFLLAQSLLVIRNGKLVAEAYPRDTGDLNRINNIKSATKSFTGILACIALQEGYLDSLDLKLSSIYPEYFINHTDLEELTIKQALTMQTGLVRNNKDDGYNFFVTDNTVEFALSSNIMYEPGTVFYYSDINPQLVSFAIQKRYGSSMEDFAREYLFEPLGIKDWYWQAGRDSVSYGASNLNLRPRDMARFGQMLLQNGSWGDRQIVDSSLVAEATGIQVQLNYWAYGYYFWINPDENVYWAAGHGGQTIFIAPDKNLVVVVTAWPYVMDSEPWKDNFEVSLYKKILNSCK